jgi:hypothetical protein
MTETIWGYWLDREGGTFIELPKLPLTRAGFTKPPFTVTRPDGKVLLVVERQPEKEAP